MNGTMVMNRIRTCLLALVMSLALAVPATAQDFQLFAPAELSEYGSGMHAKEGFFFTFDMLQWTITAPDAVTIGQNFTRTDVWQGGFFIDENSTMNTGPYENDFTDGQRMELGYVSDHSGWLFGMFKLTSLNQYLDRSNTTVVFEDPPYGPLGLERIQGFVQSGDQDFDHDVNGNGVFGRDGIDTTVPPDGEPDEPFPTDFGDDVRLPMVYDMLTTKNRTQLWGTELMYTIRSNQMHRGGYFELFIGGRYMQFRDTFNVQGYGGILDRSFWFTDAKNNLVGPQVAARWFNQTGRITWSAEGRFMAGFNFQDISQQGRIASNLVPGGRDVPLAFGPTSFVHSLDENEWSPVVELRAQASYQLTRAIAIRVGWTGMYIDGLARASSLVNYTLPTMGLIPNQITQDAFVQGVNAGIEINR